MENGKRFEKITKYIKLLEGADFGESGVDVKTDEATGKKSYSPYTNYSQTVRDFMKEAYECVFDNSDIFDAKDYMEIVEKNIKGSMDKADVSKLDVKTVLAAILFVLRGEHFSDGYLLGFLESGTLQKFMKRLEELDNEK